MPAPYTSNNTPIIMCKGMWSKHAYFKYYPHDISGINGLSGGGGGGGEDCCSKQVHVQ